MPDRVRLADFIAALAASPLAPAAGLAPWELTTRARETVTRMLDALGDGYAVTDGVAVHATAVVEPGAVLRPGTVVPRLGLVDQG